MPRSKPHFKVRTTVRNHSSCPFYADNDMLAIWVRLGIEAIERFADRTGDTFILHERELPAVTGRNRSDSALVLLNKLVSTSPVSYKYSSGTYAIHFANLAKVQGFRNRNGNEQGATPTPTPTPTPTANTSTSRNPSRGPDIGEQKSPNPQKKKTPEPGPDAIRLADLWAEIRLKAVGTAPPIGATLGRWRDEIRKMIKLDGKPAEDIEAVIRFLYDPAGNLAREYPFACHSPRNLREKDCDKFDRVHAAITEKPRTPIRTGPKETPLDRANALIARRRKERADAEDRRQRGEPELLQPDDDGDFAGIDLNPPRRF